MHTLAVDSMLPLCQPFTTQSAQNRIVHRNTCLHLCVHTQSAMHKTPATLDVHMVHHRQSVHAYYKHAVSIK